MITFKNVSVFGFEPAIRGMRNPMNSWDKSDSKYIHGCFHVGENDYKLMKKLASSGTDHRKFMRMLVVYADITAPLYWWKEFDTYKIGTVANSCSTMHKIQAKEFALDDFSHEHLFDNHGLLAHAIIELDIYRDLYNNYDKQSDEFKARYTKKDIWWQMIQLLPSSYNQKRTVMMNYEVLANIYKSRKSHKLDEWKTFCKWIENAIPYSELITGEDKD